MTQGHVFLVRGNLRHLKCDAIAYSGNTRSEPSKTWVEDVKGGIHPEETRIDASRVVRRWSGIDGEPAPYVVPVAGSPNTPIEWYTDAVRVFLQRATADMTSHLKSDPKARGRTIPKLAMPLLGANKGGKERAQGELLHATLRLLWEFTGEHAVDIALVLDHNEAFDAAQSYRRRQGADPWRALPASLVERADALATP